MKLHQVSVIGLGLYLSSSTVLLAGQQQLLATLNDATTFPIDTMSIEGKRYGFDLPDGQSMSYLKTDVFCAGSGCQTKKYLTINGCPTIGTIIMPVSIADYAVNNDFNMGLNDWKNQYGEPSRLYSLVNADKRDLRYVSMRSEGSGSGFKDFADGKLDFMFASRRPTNDEAQAIYGVASNNAGAVKSNEYLLGYDAVRVIVHPDNPIKKLSIEQLSKVFSGEITNWSELGGQDMVIKAYVPSSNAAAYGMFKSKVMNEHGRLFSDDELKTLSSNVKLLRKVNSDVSAIAFYAAGHRGRLPQNALNVVDDCGIEHTADNFSIKTTEYPLAHPLYIYTHQDHTDDMSMELIDFITSDGAQYGLEQLRGVSTTLPELQVAQQSLVRLDELAESANKGDVALAKLVAGSQRLSSRFHFDEGQAELGALNRTEVKRLARYLERNKISKTKVLLIGFATEQESETSPGLALKRAKSVEGALRERGISVDVVKGFSDVAPVSCDTMKYQGYKNRRVEVWLQNKHKLVKLSSHR